MDTRPTPAIAPVATRDRIHALDALRGLALCGVLFAHMVPFSTGTFHADPLVGAVDGGADDLAWWAYRLGIDGAMRALFSMLFGAGLILFMDKALSGRAPWGWTRTRMLRRLGWLFVFGLVNSTLLLFPGDILVIYAPAGLLALVALRWPVRRLLWAAAALVLACMAVEAHMERGDMALLREGPALEAAAAGGARLDPARTERLEDWRAMKAPPATDPDYSARAAAARLGPYAGAVAFAARESWELTVFWEDTLLYLLDALSMMLLGMALYRLGWLQGAVPRGTYLALAAVGVAAGLAIRAWAAGIGWDRIDGGWEPSAATILLPDILYPPGRVLMALGYLGLFHLAYGPAKALFRPFEHYGRMALTGYLGHSALAALIFSGLGLWAQYLRADLLVIGAGILVVQIAFAWAWLRRFEQGPVEALWRLGTYGRCAASPRRAAAAA